MNLQEIYIKAACGDYEAGNWLFRWNVYCNGIDDLIDGEERPTPDALLEQFANAATLYTHAFFQRNSSTLLPLILSATLTYADSVEFERATEDWKRKVADVIRFTGNDIVVAVAAICGGLKHAREISRLLREDSWKSHHDENGNPK